ncbi:MAG: glycosyl hydrolase 53 family protein, partial [Clostridia bacterium]|nr:glycosyl hydrolase 53 family protein [Clostridia bacterium]
MILGIDVSTYPEELEQGARYFDGDVEIDPLDAFRANGVDFMRIRLWNDPRSATGEPYLAGTCDLDHSIRLAKLAKSR